MKRKWLYYISVFAVLICVLSVFTSGCGYKSKKLNDSFASFASENSYLTVNQYKINDIPAAEVYVDNGSLKPLIILLHGVMSSKEGMLADAKTYADNNFHVVMIDAASQGERANKYTMFPKIVVDTAKDLNTVIRYYTTQSNVDTSRIGLVGFSMGSFTAYWYVAYGDYPIKAVVAEVGTPDFSFITADSQLNMRYKAYHSKKSNWSDEKFTDYMQENNPFNQYSRFESVSLFMLNGAKDELIPYLGSLNLYNYLKNINADARFILYQNSGHLDLPYDEVKSLELEFMKNKL